MKISEPIKVSLVKAIKEAMRVILIAIIPIVIGMLESGAFDMRVILASGGIALLKFIDKLLHELGKELEKEVLIKGITRF